MDLWKRRVRPALEIPLFGLEGTKLLDGWSLHRVVEIQDLGVPTTTTRDVRAKASAPLAFVEADDKARSWPDNIVIEMAMHMVLDSAVFVV